MGLFDSIAGQVAGALGGGAPGQQGGLLEVVTGLINNPQTGGLQGLIQTFEQKGLGNVISSWVGTGQNLPISAEQLQSVLGNEQVQAMAQKLGLSPQDISSHLSQLLPQVVDKVTPDGTVPQGGDALQSAIGMLGGLFGKQG
ncbi:YidB family protein [Aquabacterium sp.]|uniref:YidB family protein n=1 Tax=Aquabacterium sp. TaxID=1872578 RepID=UPI004037F2CA